LLPTKHPRIAKYGGNYLKEAVYELVGSSTFAGDYFS
jgi:hypothetical protein